jgi:hypothetical protein
MVLLQAHCRSRAHPVAMGPSKLMAFLFSTTYKMRNCAEKRANFYGAD